MADVVAFFGRIFTANLITKKVFFQQIDFLNKRYLSRHVTIVIYLFIILKCVELIKDFIIKHA